MQSTTLTMNSPLRKRSGRSWLFRNFKRGTVILTLASLFAWIWSPNSYVYYVGAHFAVGLAKGTFDIMLATGARRVGCTQPTFGGSHEG